MVNGLSFFCAVICPQHMFGMAAEGAVPSRPTPLPDDDSFWRIYEKGETIGRGHFAKVKLVRHRESGGFYAAKILDKMLEEHQEDYESMMREFKVLRSLNHKNIVNLQDAYETPTSLILVCELATGGELMHRIAEENDIYTEDEVRRHCYVILETIGFMHQNGVVHRDLKPENILLSDKCGPPHPHPCPSLSRPPPSLPHPSLGLEPIRVPREELTVAKSAARPLAHRTDDAHILIADFGLGRFVSNLGQKMETVCGTHHYLAPELVQCDRGELQGYDRSIDVWGIGLIAFIMLFGFNPFLRDSNLATHTAILDCRRGAHRPAIRAQSHRAPPLEHTPPPALPPCPPPHPLPPPLTPSPHPIHSPSTAPHSHLPCRSGRFPHPAPRTPHPAPRPR